MSSGNPAGRLLRIVEEARQLQDQTPVKQAWQQILEVDKRDHAQLMFRLGRVMLLPEQTMAEIREHYPEEEEDQAHWVQQVNRALLQGSLGGKWDSVKKHLDDHTVRYLRLASAMLKKVRGENLLHEDQLKAMREKLEEVLKELEATNLSLEAKATIRRHVNNALNALDEYKICGKQGIEAAAHQAIGEMAVNHAVREEVSRTPAGRKFAGALVFIVMLIGGASDTLQLVNDAPEFLADMRGAEELEVEAEAVTEEVGSEEEQDSTK